MRLKKHAGAYIFVFALLLWICILPISSVQSSSFKGPPYPNLEPFTIESSDFAFYDVALAGSIVPSYHFPELKDLKSATLHSYHPLTASSGSFSLSGTTGPDGNVTGSFTFSGLAEQYYEDGEVDTYQVKAEGQITNAKAAFDDKGFLRIMGAAHYQRKFEQSGPVSLTMTYSSLVTDEEAGERVRIGGTVTATAQLAFVSCISDLEEINYCYFETGTAYGDYGFSAGFTNAGSQDFVWFNNLDFEFGLISGIDFDPEAHHKLTPQADEEEADKPVLDESYLDVPEKAEKIDDNQNAGFSVSLGCDNLIYPEDGITCNLGIQGGAENQAYTVNWITDGFLLKSSTVILGADNFFFTNPPPGIHAIEVQVIDQATFNTRVSSTSSEVLVPQDVETVKPWTQAAAGAGSVAILAAWLWAEWIATKTHVDWFDQQQEKTLEADRKAWFEKQMARNDEVRARQQNFDDYQQACEKEWKRFRSVLLDVIDKHHKSDYLIDLYDDMHSDVYKDGKWDGKALQRLEDLINTHLQMDRKHDAYTEWKRKLDFVQKRQKAFTDLTTSWTAMGVELTAGILTGGASEAVFIPTRAIGNATYASKRAELLGKTGWNAAKSVMVESGIRLGMDYVFSKVGEKVVGKLFDYGGKGIQRVIGEEGMEAVADWWQRTSVKLGTAPKPDVDLPVIRQSWGKGPQVFVHKPIFKPGRIPPVDLGMDNYLNNNIRPLSNELADDMGRLFREGVDVEPNLNNLLRAGERYTITASDEIAVRMMNNPAYKQAVREGIVPSSAQQVVYQARDKICKNAIQETFERLDDVLLDGKSVSSRIKSVAITGTGAKPLSPQAVGRYTDFDSTVIAGDTEIARKAERIFSDTFREVVEEAGVNPRSADINMFSGIHADDITPTPGAYTSEPLIHWQKVDLVNRGRSTVRTDGGGMLFDAHPDIAPMEGFGPMDPIPHYPIQPETAIADARQVILNHLNDAAIESGERLTQSAILTQEGKHALRVWKTINSGSGQSPPAWISRLEELKRNPNVDLSTREVNQLWKEYSQYFDLPSNLGD